jgi:gluconokinase
MSFIKEEENNFSAVIVMGVSGSGKSTVGQMLAEQLGWTYIESDDYHSAEDINKMSNGIPLTDADRWPWLNRLHDLMADHAKQGQSVVLACSALKQSYRDLLAAGLKNVFFVYLKGDYDLIFERMKSRDHYMQASMLRSQFDALEEPINALMLNIEAPPGEIVRKISQHLS